METVWEYMSKLIPKEVSNKLLDFINKEGFDVYNTKDLKDFEALYRLSMHISVRNDIRKIMITDFQFPFFIRDHFVSRLIARFRDKAIDFVMTDIKYAYKTRKHRKNLRSKVLTGVQLKIIYNKENNEVVSAFTPKRLDLRRRRRLD